MLGDPLHARALLTAAEAEQYLGIPAATVRSWARRGRLLPVGLDERSHGGTAHRSPLYLAADLHEMALRRTSRAALAAGWLPPGTHPADVTDPEDIEGRGTIRSDIDANEPDEGP